MLKLFKTNDKLEVVGNQVGKPTYAGDLAEFLIYTLIGRDNKCYGTYHFAGEDTVSWYGFAKEIAERAESDVEIIRNDSFGAPIAKRPEYSVLETDYTHNMFKFGMRPLRYGVDRVIGKMKNM